MRKDLKHWAQALRLAEQLDPSNIGLIAKEHAQMLEVTGEHAAARAHYQKALDMIGGSGEADVRWACNAGIARCTLLAGDVRQGRQLVLQLNNVSLYKECAGILEAGGQLQEAAEMYERGGVVEKAAAIYIQAKNFAAAAPLMAKVSNSKLQLQYAKAQEAVGKYAEAAAAYELAGDLEAVVFSGVTAIVLFFYVSISLSYHVAPVAAASCPGDLEAVVRLNLDQLNNAAKAYALVRKTQLKDCAAMLAKHALQRSDFKSAVEFLVRTKPRVCFPSTLCPLPLVQSPASSWFATEPRILQTERNTAPRNAQRLAPRAHNLLSPLCLYAYNTQVMSGQLDQAFDIAQSSGQMDAFATALTANSRPGDFERIAEYYESRGEFEKAGDMWVENEEGGRAIKAYLKGKNSEAALKKAVSVVERSRSKEQANLVLDHVNGSVMGGAAKDALRFSLNLMLGNLSAAAKDALEMARFEQEEGNYRLAHDKLLASYQPLQVTGPRTHLLHLSL